MLVINLEVWDIWLSIIISMHAPEYCYVTGQLWFKFSQQSVFIVAIYHKLCRFYSLMCFISDFGKTLFMDPYFPKHFLEETVFWSIYNSRMSHNYQNTIIFTQNLI